MKPDLAGVRRRRLLLLAASCLLLTLTFVTPLRQGVSEMFEPVADGFEQRYPDDYRMIAWLLGEPPAEEPPRKTLGLPLLQLHLSDRDLAHFRLLYERYEDPTRGWPYYFTHRSWPHPDYGLPYYERHNVWRKASLTYDGEERPIRIKLHGRQPDGHHRGDAMSFSVKLRDRGNIDRANRFNLIIGPRRSRDYDSIIALADHFGLLHQEDTAVEVRVNDGPATQHYFERRFNDAFMEATGRASLRRFRNPEPSDDSSRSHVEVEDLGRLDDTLGAALRGRNVPTEHHAPLIARYRELNEAVFSSERRDVDHLFDADYIRDFEAARRLYGFRGHGFGPQNLYVFLDFANGRFYPALTRDNFGGPVKAGPNLEAELSVYRDSAGEVPLRFLILLARSDAIRMSAYRRLYHATAPDELEKLTRGMSSGARVRHNAAVWRSYLERAEPTATFAFKDGAVCLDLEPHAMAGLQAMSTTVSSSDDGRRGSVEATLFERRGASTTELRRALVPRIEDRGRVVVDLHGLFGNRVLSDALGPDAERVPRSYHVVLTSSSAPESAGGTFRNFVTGQPLSPVIAKPTAWSAEHEALLETVRTRDRVDEQDALEPEDAWRRDHPELPLAFQRGEVTLAPGTHRVRGVVRLPANRKLRLQAGTELSMDEGAVLHCPAGLEVRGSVEAPVRIYATDPARPFGSIAVAGGPGVHTDIEGLELSGGSEAWVDGAFFSGGLSIHHNEQVRIVRSRIEDNRADDGLNVKYGAITLEDVSFRGNRADQVDLDTCTGVVRRCRFVAAGGGVNGDGLDVSASSVVVSESSFEDFVDKGVSIGEVSDVLVMNGELRGCKMGIAVKDDSRAALFGNRYEGNEIDIAAYQKKKSFGGGHVLWMGAPADLSALRLTSDPRSRVQETSWDAWFAGRSAPPADADLAPLVERLIAARPSPAEGSLEQTRRTLHPAMSPRWQDPLAALTE